MSLLIELPFSATCQFSDYPNLSSTFRHSALFKAFTIVITSSVN